MTHILYKSLPKDRAPHGHKFRKGVWYKVDDIKICNKGFHASENVIDAMLYVDAEWLAKVEVRGDSQKQDDKQCWSEMRVLEWYKWTRKDSISLAIYAAELCIDNFEKAYPNDDRPRNAIEAAKAVLKKNTKKNREAAQSAAWSAAKSARSAESAAWSVAKSARSAWSAAWSAAKSAAKSARSAWSAARSAESAAWSAWSAQSATENKKKCHTFVLKRAGFIK